jgi:hypothetical protein
MASRVFASRLASQMATKAARPAMRAPVAAAKRTITTGESRENFFSLSKRCSIQVFDHPEGLSIAQLSGSMANINS